jgi:hypothetical protein
VITAQGVAWDLEKNVRMTTESRRRIVDSRGHRYNDDMIAMTGNAAGSVALRNAVFRVIPKAYVDSVYGKAREVAVGNAMTLATKRDEVIVRLMKAGVPKERILPRIGKNTIEDVGLEELEILIGLGTAIKNGDQAIDVAFPPPSSDDAAKNLENELKAQAAKEVPKKADKKAEKPKAPIDPEAAAAEEALGGRQPGDD